MLESKQNQLEFSITIKASKENVWKTLWSDETFRQWANIIDEGTYMVGVLQEGNEIQFISGNGYGVTSLVEKLIPGDFLLIRHKADTQDVGQRAREDQWTGGKESYTLKEVDGFTTLTAIFDAPPELEDYFNETYPKAFEKVKELAE
jgi:uncharacterized protein YndB with AHSA1/START domain